VRRVPAQRLVQQAAAVGFGEIYIQTGYDPTPAPPDKHLLAVFGQYAPYDIADGDWDSRRKDVEKQFVDLISRFAPDFPECLEESEVLGPPDIERRIGLTGGNIFQGEVTPAFAADSKSKLHLRTGRSASSPRWRRRWTRPT